MSKTSESQHAHAGWLQAPGARPTYSDAATALILRWGYNKTTIDDIARQAGVGKGTVYLHWNTREELFATLH